MALAKVFPLNSFQTQDLLLLESRAPGTYRIKTRVQGNSLLSTVFVKDVGAGGTVKVNYFETTTGNAQPITERKELPSHPLITVASNDPSRITVTPFHNTPELEVIVLNDDVEFGVRVTVVATFASDLDAALKFDCSTHTPTVDKGLPFMCLDTDLNQVKFIRCKNGNLIFQEEDNGAPFFFDGSATTVPGGSVNLDSFVVPALTERKINTVIVSSFASGIFTMTAGGSTIGTGRTMPGGPNINLVWAPKRSIAAGTTVSLDFAQVEGENACPVQSHGMALDVT